MWWHPHPFSLSAEPVLFDSSGRGRLRITVRNLGRGSAQLARLKPGTRVAIEGPYGLFSTAARSRNRVVMIGAGIGITPIRALLERTPFEPGNATVLLRGHSEAELYLGDEVLELCRRRGATLFHLTGPRTAGEHSWLPESAVHSGHRLASYAPDIADADVYICGPDAWARSVISGSPRGRCPRRTTPLRKVRLVRIRAAVSAALASAGILLAGWQSGAHVAETGSAAAATSAATSSGAASGTSSGSGAERTSGSRDPADPLAPREQPAAPGPRRRPPEPLPAVRSRPVSAPFRCRSP